MMPMLKKPLLSLLLVATFLATPVAGEKNRPGNEPGDLSYSALADITSGSKPTVYIRTNEVVYEIGDPISIFIDIADNRHLATKTFFLYLQDMETGEVRYINVGEGVLDPGTVTDLSGDEPGVAGSYPIPTVQNFVLFGPGGLFGAALNAGAEMVGNHRIVFELRDVTGQRIFQRSSFDFVVVSNVELLPAQITTDTTLTNDTVYILDNAATFVRSGATLTIEPGTYILGAGVGALIIDRGARIMAEGTASRPIVMTSIESVGNRSPSDWGGLIINGRAPLNVPGGVAVGEGDTGAYGGTDPNDSSGVLRYLRVEFAGIEFSPDNELNGIAFQGVGRGTVIEFIQVHYSKDDGVEFFGGTADAKYLLLTANADDSLDWTEGWTGRVQFLVAQQNKADADQGIEADSNADNNDLLPRANPTIFNATLIGGNALAGTTEESDLGVLLREGTAGQLYNFIVTGFGQAGVAIDQDATVVQAQGGALIFDNSIFFGNATRGGPQFSAGGNVTSAFSTETFLLDTMTQNRTVDPMLRDPFNLISPDYRPRLESPSLNVNFVRNPPDDGFFEPVTFLGGVDPLNDWTAGWTTNAPN